ncbi:MAG: hypothetical protein RLZZ04_2309 [Cyanobacteriota bacterium]|jgi:hypothetical protein
MDNIFLSQEDFEQIFKSNLKTETYPKSIETLFSDRLLGKIDYKPYYQRNYVWDKHKASYFIESILLGTEIPPLIFFNNGQGIEVIDGRQRFETIKRFKDGQFSLTKKGLSVLKKLAKSTYDSLGNDEETREIIDIFLDAKIRIIEFKIVNEPKLDISLEDKIKKEIFRRYNSGITPLKKFDIDNAVYVKDEVSIYFKNLLKEDTEFVETMIQLFFLNENKKFKAPSDGKLLQFIRKYLVLDKFPIKYYARGTSRGEILEKLYAKLVNETEDIQKVCGNFIEKVNLVKDIQKIFSSFSYKHNRLVYECLLWSLIILEKESIDISKITEEDRISAIGEKIFSNISKFSESESHYYSNVMERFLCVSNIVADSFSTTLDIYVDVSTKASQDLKKLRETEITDTITKLNELESLRITKPDPSRNSIDDIVRRMDRRKFLIRPAYQREEVINLSKASAIIESILLDINLPPLFIFKRSDGISEVIDGQQRLLTILGYLGKEYIDEYNNRKTTKNSKFPLKGLSILKDLNKKKFEDLPDNFRDKIWDFGLLIVEIEERLNPQFNPVDLFVRLNDKPYPIKENSFEMWNSWVDRDIISAIKSNVSKYKDWFYIKVLKNDDGSRMENEELYTSLVYLEFQNIQHRDIWKYLYVYIQERKINVRFSSTKEITQVLEVVSQNTDDKKTFLKSIKNVESFISKLKLILLNKDIADEQEKKAYFLSELNTIFKAERNLKTFRRKKQDFYILWYLLNPICKEMIELKRLEIRKRVKDIFVSLRDRFDNSEEITQDSFKQMLNDFHRDFQQNDRKLRLAKLEKNKLIQQQKNIDPLTGALIFIGDDVAVDHVKPISIGGEDTRDNIQITHKSSNLRKGSKFKES